MYFRRATQVIAKAEDRILEMLLLGISLTRLLLLESEFADFLDCYSEI